MKQELTPRRIANLRTQSKNARTFVDALLKLGYREFGSGCFRRAYRWPTRGKYVIKVALCVGGRSHTRAQNRHFETASPEVRAKMLPFLVYGPDFQVQEYVKECRNWDCYVPGFYDTSGHNHTHRKGKTLAFDWMGKPR